MKHGLLFLIVAVALVGTFGGGVAYAQDTTIITVPFGFTFNNKDMPAGRYEVTVTDQTVLKLIPANGQDVVAPAITRLAVREAPPKEPTIVFDRMGEKYYFSELWVPGEDGYLINDTKQPHTHHVIKGKKKT